MISVVNVSQADFNGLQFVCQGDGVATVLKFDVSKPPFKVPFNGALPGGVLVGLQSVGSALGNIQTILTVDTVTLTFNPPPPLDKTVGVNVTFSYNSLP